MTQTRVVAGQMHDEDGPLQDAQLVLLRLNANPAGCVLTARLDTDGAYRLAVPAGRYLVFIAVGGHGGPAGFMTVDPGPQASIHELIRQTVQAAEPVDAVH